MDNVKFKVAVYPTGYKSDKKKDDPNWVIFGNKQEKELYIKAEFKWCRDEERAHMAAMTKNQRDKSKKTLYLKRVAFATHRGYTPSIRNRQELMQGQVDYTGGVA